MFVGKNFLPVDDQSQFEINVRAPEGSSLAATSALAERIALTCDKLPGVTDTLTTIGGGQQELVNVASIYVKLTADRRAQRSRSSDLMVRARTEILGKVPASSFPGNCEPACSRSQRFPAADSATPTFST